MLSEDQIRDALHATRAIPVDVPNPHGPFGLEQLAETLARAGVGIAAGTLPDRVERPLSLPFSTWKKVEDLARSVSASGQRRVTASELITALIEKSIMTA